MNVAFDPWIPVVSASGEPLRASLEEVFTEGREFADLAVRPHERVSLMRLFLCVAHAALGGPGDYDEWCEVPNKLSGAAHTYLTNWKDSFELFHPEKPWLQVGELRAAGDSGRHSPVSLLDFELATGHSSTLYDHGGLMGARRIEPERVALTLLTFQNFAPGGGCPVAQWKTTRTAQVGNPDAPCISQSMAHCMLRGKSLGETIHLNLPCFDTIKRVYGDSSTDGKKPGILNGANLGRPVWEFFPESPNNGSDRVVNATRTYIGRLTPISRWVRLIEGSDQMYCCNGFKYDTYKDGFIPEPTAAVRLVTKKDKKGTNATERRVVSANPQRAIWRELSSLLIKPAAEGLGGPIAMENAPHESEFDFHVCAITRDQASMDIAVESVFHIRPAFQANLSFYEAEVVVAESYSRRLRAAVEEYRQEVDRDWRPRVERTQPRDRSALIDRLAGSAFLSYWTTVEKNLPLLMDHIEAIGTDAANPTKDAWRKMLRGAAYEAYRIACGQETPRQLRAFAKGWQKLTAARQESQVGSNEKEGKEA